jgi:hypothetical protein
MPGHDTSSFVSRDRGIAGVIDGRIFTPQNGLGNCQPIGGRTLGGRAAAKHHANRGTVFKKVSRLKAAKKNNTSAETYGEPQTPAEPR